MQTVLVPLNQKRLMKHQYHVDGRVLRSPESSNAVLTGIVLADTAALKHVTPYTVKNIFLHVW